MLAIVFLLRQAMSHYSITLIDKLWILCLRELHLKINRKNCQAITK